MADNKKSRVLTKMVIHSFEKNDFKEEDKKLMFTTPINPETFTKTNHIELDLGRAHGQPGTNPKYKSTKPEEIKIEFVLDGTQTMEGYVDQYKKMEVHDQIEAFTNCVYKYEGKIHRPRFLILRWGSEIRFPCVLSHLDINFSLFNPNGNPLRAKVTATFVKYQTDIAMEAAKRMSSPDLTHMRRINQGDRLDLMTYKIYNTPNYLLQVAKANNLSTIRRLRPGTDMFFPPLDKNEN